MPRREKVVLSWSGSAMDAVALFELKSPEYKISSLFSVLDSQGSSHLISQTGKSLLELQARSLEMPLAFCSSSSPSDVTSWNDCLKPLQKKGLDGIAYSLSQNESSKLREEKSCDSLLLKATFPLWKWEQKEVLRVFFSLGYKAIVVGVDPKKLPPPFLGREFDREFVNELPTSIDPCGENAEFFTFVYDGPFFQRSIPFERGALIEKGSHTFLELRGGSL